MHSAQGSSIPALVSCSVSRSRTPNRWAFVTGKAWSSTAPKFSLTERSAVAAAHLVLGLVDETLGLVLQVLELFLHLGAGLVGLAFTLEVGVIRQVPCGLLRAALEVVSVRAHAPSLLIVVIVPVRPSVRVRHRSLPPARS